MAYVGFWPANMNMARFDLHHHFAGDKEVKLADVHLLLGTGW